MIGQPWGSVLVALIGFVSVAIAATVVVLVTAFFGWDPARFITGLAIVVIGCFVFYALMEWSARLEIRWFCRKHGLRVLKITGHKRHYGVYYSVDGENHHGRWPAHFEKWESKKSGRADESS